MGMGQRLRWVLCIVIAVAVLPDVATGQRTDAQPAQLSGPRRDAAFVTGSSTVYPFTEAVVTAVAEATRTPKARVDSTGTVRGFNLFCQGMGMRYPDVQDASRRINGHEFDLCGRNGVREIIEIPIGFDGIIIAVRRDIEPFSLTRAQIWLAVAKEVPRGGRLVPNPYTRWAQIDPALPDWPIAVLGPPPTSGTRDSLTDLALAPGCQSFAEVRDITDVARKRAVCATVREDGIYQNAGEDDEKTVAQVEQPGSSTVGIFGYSFLVGHSRTIMAAAVDGVVPNFETISSGRYPLARPLYIYVKRAQVGLVPGLKEFLPEYVSDRAMGPGGYLAKRGLVPLDPGRLRQVRESVGNLEVMLRRPS